VLAARADKGCCRVYFVDDIGILRGGEDQ